MPTEAVIFDMDGLLIDSEPLWVRAEIEVFGAHGVVLGPEECAQTKGLRTDDVVRHWHAARGFADLANVEARLIDRVAALIAAEGEALAGVAHAVAVARASGAKLALASSSPARVIAAALARLGLVFDVVRSAENEPYGKPHPGVFLRTADDLGVSPLGCVVLEDSLNGVIAAKAARMRCIAVPDPRENGGRVDPRFALADAILPSLADLTLAVLGAS